MQLLKLNLQVVKITSVCMHNKLFLGNKQVKMNSNMINNFDIVNNWSDTRYIIEKSC